MSKLETKSLVLKVRSLADADALLKLYISVHNADKLTTPIPDRDAIVKSVFVSDTHWRKNGFGYWSIYLKNDLIGTVGLIRNADRSVQFEIELDPKYRKKGYAAEIKEKVFDFGMRLHKLPDIKMAVQNFDDL